MKKKSVTVAAVLVFICALMLSGCSDMAAGMYSLPGSISFPDKEIVVFKGGSAQVGLSATGGDAEAVGYFSSDSDIFTVASDGTVYGKRKGSAVLTATSDCGSYDRCLVRVVPHAGSIYLDKVSINAFIGDEYTFSYRVSPADAVYSVEWSSSDECVATVNDGVVVAHGKGTAVIRVQTDNGLFNECELTVREQPVLTTPAGSLALYSDLSEAYALYGEPEYVTPLPLSCEAYVFNPNGDFSGYTVVFSDGKKVLGFYTDSPDFSVGELGWGMSLPAANAVFGTSEEAAANIIWAFDDTAYQLFFDNLNDGTAYGIAVLGEGCDVLASEPDYRMLEGYNMILADLTNSVRVKWGLNVLGYDTTVAACAAAHSLDMAENGFTAHESSDGRKVIDRITETGLKWHFCGENIAAGLRLPFAASAALLNSEGHRRNIMNDKYDYIGIGTVYKADSEYRIYSTQDYLSLY